MPTSRPNDFDSPWKEALEQYFRPFLALCFPEIERGIDWSRGFEFLDKELQRVVRDAEQGRGHVDKLAKVWRSTGEEARVLAHVEVQHEPEQEFEGRMFGYNVRLRQRYSRTVVSLGVLADSQPSWRPSCFVDELWGYRMEMRFPTVKLLDFAGRRQELETSDNPFAVIVLAHLDAAETSTNPVERSRRKMSLVRTLYHRGLSRQGILDLFRLVDWLMQLPQDWEDRFREDLAEYEEEQNMPYVTSIERIGIRKGRELGLSEGREKALLESLLRFLTTRFGSLPDATVASVSAIRDPERLAYLQERVASAATLAEFERELGLPT